MAGLRISTVNVNPDLTRERGKGTIAVEKLTHIIHGGEEYTRKRREIEEFVLRDKIVSDEPEYHYQSRPERYDQAVKLSAHYIRLVRENPALAQAESANLLLNSLIPLLNSPIGLHISMFTTTITSQATQEQQDQWIKKLHNFDIIGTYAQTEMGHGSHVRGLETTATYDPRTEQFVLHTPTISATKWWPGGLGKTVDHAVIMAQLYSNGVCHGVHAFVAQLRDLDTHEPLPGITLGDIGPKFGFDVIDNGFMSFDHYRIPRDAMLMKNAQIGKDGTYVRAPRTDKLHYGTLLVGRVDIITRAAMRGLAAAVTIAIRYSCVRRQSEIIPGEPEPLILDYQTQQYKLLPQLATAYAIIFTGQKMWEMYLKQVGNIDALPELHSMSAGLKAFATAASMSGVEQCRMACGGHGFSQASGLPKVYSQITVLCTLEGENTVMLLQTARFLMKAFQNATQGQLMKGSLTYLTVTTSLSRGITDQLDPAALVEAYQRRARRLVAAAAARFAKLVAEGKPAYDAWNQSSIVLVKAAEAHCHLYMVESFLDKVTTIKDVAISSVLMQLFKLYATYGISNHSADFLQDLTPSQLDVINQGLLGLLSKLRQNAVALVDAFDFSDRTLGSILGRYDGNVYENMYNWAARSPLNETQVHDSFKYIKELRQSVNHSKL